jgi:SAM-dependent methyltransferase
MLVEELQQWAKEHISDETHFIRAVFSGRRHGQQQQWRKVVVRPVLIRSKRHLQISYFDEKRDITKNYAGAEISSKLDELLALPFSQIILLTTERETQVRISKKGKVFMQEKITAQPRPSPSMTHDRQKELLLSVESNADFLHAIGILTPNDRVRSSMQRKYRQINEFLRLIVETHALEQVTHSPITIVDCGCGSAYLTFAVYHYLNNVKQMPTRITGVDIKADLLDKQAHLALKLGWDGIKFRNSTIIDFTPDASPDIVLALHACDTATDEALAQAIRWESHMIFSAPCCHHHLQAQIEQQIIPQVFKPVMRHGILKERLGDVLTDSFRAQLLRVMGYRTEVMEFISAEHTDKNLMIRGVKTTPPGDSQAIAEYRDLKSYWQVQPYLEQLLADKLLDYEFTSDS